jgi:hypothetical protein
MQHRTMSFVCNVCSMDVLCIWFVRRNYPQKDFIYYNIIAFKWGESTHFPGRNDPGWIDPGRTGNRGETTRIHKQKNNNSFILVYFNYLFISCIQKKIIIHSFWSTFVKDLKRDFSCKINKKQQKEVICALVQHLSHFMHFWVGTKKSTSLLFLCCFLLIL